MTCDSCDIDVTALYADINRCLLMNLILALLAFLGMVISMYLVYLTRVYRDDLVIFLVVVNASFLLYSILELRSKRKLFKKLKKLVIEWDGLEDNDPNKEKMFAEICGFIRVYFYKKFDKHIKRRDYVDLF
jgi:hypothetical protein